MATSNELALVVSSNTTPSYEELLESQKELITKQICELQNIVTTQCKLTGVNPLSQEMAAGALSIKIGKRPRDLLNPKAIKYMQSIFSVKDEINKKESRAISALFGLTATQVRDFFNGQRSRVRRFIRLSREKAIQSAESVQKQNGLKSSNVDTPNNPVPLNSVDPTNNPVPLNSVDPTSNPVPLNSVDPTSNPDPLNSVDPTINSVPLNSVDQTNNPGPLNSVDPTNNPVPLNSVDPTNNPVPLNSVDSINNPVPLNTVDPSSIEAPSCSAQDEVLPDTNDKEKYFIANIFNLLRKEETFSGQVKLMEWILQIQNASVLYWFLTNGGVMILASWLSQAAIEEQTTVLHVILRVLCHLPLHKALPAHMSAILQSVNKLRFYRGSDISNRAKSLLSRWSKMFARSQALRKPNANISSVDAQNEMLLKQSIGEIMENESLESRIDNPGAIYSLQENPENSRSQSIKMLTGPSDDSNMKLLRGVSSSHTRERRKVQLVEQPGQKPANRAPPVTRVVFANQGRPLSADDIQKAKMRAQFMKSKYGENYISPQVKTKISPAKSHIHPKVEENATSSSSVADSPARPHVQPKVEEHKSPVMLRSVDEMQTVPVHGKEVIDSEEPLWKKCKRLQISWATPPEMMINKEWSVGSGENSKEIDVQNNRIKREKEVFYTTVLEIPPNPKEPWDREMDYDDSLTPEIPTEQLPDDDDNMVSQPTETGDTSNYTASTSTLAENNSNMPGPDLELLAVLLKNPQIVFALTAGQGGSLTNEQMVRLLDAMKDNAARGGSVNSLVNGLVERRAEEKVEVSLPSPTPSSNPVTSGWRSDSTKNPFSRQSVTVNGDAYALPGVHFQETTQQTFAPIAHQRFSSLLPDRRTIPAAINGLSTASFTQQSAVHQRFSDTVPDQMNIPAAAHATSNPYFLPEQGGTQIQPQRHMTHSWAGRDSLAPGPYSSMEHGTNYNTYGTREFAQPGSSHAGTSRVRNRDGPGYESWSPSNSPTRPNEYVEGWEYSDPHGRGYNHRPEMSRMQHDIPRYRDYDGSRWRDRRR